MTLLIVAKLSQLRIDTTSNVGTEEKLLWLIQNKTHHLLF